MDGGTISGAAISSAFTATLRISQIVYELKAVGEQTRDLLDSTNHIQTTMQAVRTLRRQKSMHLEKTEKEWIDNVLLNTEKTLGNVAQLIEPARVEMQTKIGSIGLVRRGVFVFRDSPKVATNLSRLGLASQSLNTVMNILCARDGQTITSPIDKSPPSASDNGKNPWGEVKLPPTYRESEFLNRKRSHAQLAPVAAERPVLSSDMPEIVPTGFSRPSYSENEFLNRRRTPIPRPPARAEREFVKLDSMLEEPIKMSATMIFDDGLTPIVPSVNVTEVVLTPDQGRGNPFAGSDGLQACATSFKETDGLQVCSKSFEEPDGLQVCNEWNSPRPISTASTLLHHDELPGRRWQDQIQQQDQLHQQWQNRPHPQYQCWHGHETSAPMYPPIPRSDIQLTGRPSFEMAPILDSRSTSAVSRPDSILSHSSSTLDSRASMISHTSSTLDSRASVISQSSTAYDPRPISVSSTRSDEHGGPRMAGRSQRRAWLEFQSER